MIVWLALLAVAEPLDLDTVLREAGLAGPRIRATKAEERVAAERARLAGSWRPLEASTMIESLDGPMLTARLGVPLDAFQRRGPEAKVAAAEERAAQVRTSQVAWEVQNQAAELFLELWMSWQMNELIQRQVDVLNRLRASALAQYASGASMGHHDVLRAESEIAELEATMTNLSDERHGIWAELSTILGRAPSEPPDTATPVARPLPEVSAPDRAGPPEIEMLERMTDAASARVELEERMTWPMPMVGAFYEYGFESAMHSVGAELSVAIPLTSEADEARADVEVMKQRVALARETANAELTVARRRAVAKDRALRVLERDVVPRLREALASSEAAYSSGTGSFVVLLEDALALLRREEALIRARAERELAILEVLRRTRKGEFWRN
ncbi:MAG: TolC family protein [Deltaproteobacteria bacterium]|nr:TolC family protein [Deltaproteobacteria bacterium]